MKSANYHIGIIGAGGWGSALAILLCDNVKDVSIWTFEDAAVAEINEKHTNTTYLPGVIFPDKIKATTDSSALSGSDILVIATPTQYIRSAIQNYHFHLYGKLIVNVAKGIEGDTLMRVSELIANVSKINSDNYVVLTGPSHAEEVSRKMPTTVVAASENHNSADIIQQVFTTPNFRVYTSQDVIGCEIGGAMKNVIAIAAGVIDGLKMGDNTKAALITRGLAEISRLGIALGANPQTFSGLSGLGDLYVTCASKLSRNRFVGEQIGLGKSIMEITSEMKMVAEGVFTTKSAYQLAQKHGVELPIIEQMHSILFENANPRIAIKELMTRQTKREWWW